MLSRRNPLAFNWKSHYNQVEKQSHGILIFPHLATIRSSVLMRNFLMPWLLLNACELVNYRPKPTSWFLYCLFLCLTTLPGSSCTMKSVPVRAKVESCDADGCKDCATGPPTRPYFRTALARSVYSKILVDEEFKNFDKTKVNCPVSCLSATAGWQLSRYCVTSHSPTISFPIWWKKHSGHWWAPSVMNHKLV